MNNPLLIKLIKDNQMKKSGDIVEMSFELENKVRMELDRNKMKAVFHFDSENGKIHFDKVLGRDSNNDFYNEKNGNLQARIDEIKRVIVRVLLLEHDKVGI